MSTTDRIPLAAAQAIADEVVELLDEWTVRLAVAGSVRRGRPEVGDVELVCEPIVEVRVEAVDLFADRRLEEDLLHARCQQLLDVGVFAHRPDKNGHTSFGTKAKRLVYRGVALDVFAASEQNFGLILLLRTGPAAFSRAFVTRRSRGGLLPEDLRVEDGALWRGAELLPTPEEYDCFRLAGLDWVRPERRDAVPVPATESGSAAHDGERLRRSRGADVTTVYRVRLVIDGEEEAVALHRSARAAGFEAATWARRFPDGHVVLEGIDIADDDGDER